MDWLSVQGNQVVDQSGQEFRLRGVVFQRAEDLIGPTFPNAASGNFEVVAFPVVASLWGANSVTMGFSSGPVLRGDNDRPEYVPGTGPVSTVPGSFYLKVLDRRVAAATAAGLYVILAYRWPEPNASQPAFPNQDAQDALVALALRYWNNPRVLYALQVEPSENASKIPWSEMFRNPNVTPLAFLKPIFERMIDAIRAVHPQSLILVPGNQFGRYVHWQLQDPILRPNLVFKSHTYDTLAVVTSSVYRLADLAAQYPVFVGEFGSATGQVAPGEEFTHISEIGPMIDFFESIGAGWHAWQFNSAGPPYLLSGYSLSTATFTPNAYGDVVQERLLAQAPLAPPLGLVQDGLVAIDWEAIGVGATVQEV